MSELGAFSPIANKKSITPKFAVSVPPSNVSFQFSDTTLESNDYEEDEVNVVRFNCMQSWYLAASQKNKEQFLCSLLAKTTIRALLIFLKTLNCRRDKIHVYATAYQTTNLVYDKNLNDHNRSLKQTYLKETIKADLEWYDTLNEFIQLHMIFKLLKVSGGALVRNIFHKALSIYHLRQNENTEETVQFTKDNDLEVYKKIVPPYDSKDPQSIETEKARKKWNATINKYRIQVEGKSKIKKQKKRKAKSSRSSKKSKEKSSRSSKKSKEKSSRSSKKTKTKSSKSSKKSKGKSSRSSKKNKAKKSKKRARDQFMIDRMQLLPVWIVKQIFSFLDQKMLKKIKKVNSYWAYVIEDMLKEKAIRKYIHKALKKMEDNVNPDGIKVLVEDDKACHKLSRFSATEKRLQKLACRGAIDKKLLIADDVRIYQKSLVTDATSEKKAQYIMPVDKLHPFPRKIPVNSSLHKSPSCILNEISKITEQSSTSTPTMSEEVSSDSVIYKITSFN